MSAFEKRSLGRMARILALPTAIAFSLILSRFAIATAGSCAETEGNTGGGAVTDSSQIEENEERDDSTDPMSPPKAEKNPIAEPLSQESASIKEEAPEVPARVLPPPLKALNEAAYLYDRSAGGSCELTKAFVAVREQAASCKEDLEWIAINGTPAGRIYAAVLIRYFDKPKGELLLKDLKNAKDTMVNLNSQEGSYHYRVGEVVTDLLSANSIIRLESDR